MVSVMDAETRQFIKEEIARSMNVLLSGESGKTTESVGSIENLYPGMPPLQSRPIMMPYGFASRAPAKTLQVTGRLGSHVGARYILGHWDKERPTDLEDGESSLYCVGGYRVYAKKDRICLGKANGTYETAVLGETLVTLLTAILNAIALHVHTGNLGAPTTPPLNAAAFTQLIVQYLSNGKILAKAGG